MSKVFQVTVPDGIADEIRALQDITGHERPGSLFALLVRLYGQDLRRRMSGDVLPAQDMGAPTHDHHVLPAQDIARYSQDMGTPMQNVARPIQEQVPVADPDFKFTTPIPGFD